MSWRVVTGDCVERMRELDEASVDAVVCDPPYGLGFMGKAWDALGEYTPPEGAQTETRGCLKGPLQGRGRGIDARHRARILGDENRKAQEWHEAWTAEALRVLKPGGHLLAFGGTRTYHRLACAVEDAGFEIRDTVCWLYGSGFPKSLDVSKAIDKAAGAEREVLGRNRYDARRSGTDLGVMNDDGWEPKPRVDTAPATPEAERWDGWGTALKPAHEPVVVARKPLAGTVAGNVLEHGTGALNVDATRIGTEGGGGNGLGSHYDRLGDTKPLVRHRAEGWRCTECGAIDQSSEPHQHGVVAGGAFYAPKEKVGEDSRGRWPANVVLDPEAARMLDEQTGELTSGKEAAGGHRRNGDKFRTAYGDFEGTEREPGALYGDSGGASRFFYVAKASRGERNAGLEGFEEKEGLEARLRPLSDPRMDREQERRPQRNSHPTVKPIDLMRWLVKLVTPPGGLVLDCFSGSGTTGIACVLEGFDFVGIEREAEYVQIARARIAWWDRHRADGKAAAVLAAGEVREAVELAGQGCLFDEEAA